MKSQCRPVSCQCSKKCPRRHASVRRFLVALAELSAAGDELLGHDEPSDDRQAMLWAGLIADAKGAMWAGDVAAGHIESGSLPCCHVRKSVATEIVAARIVG